MFSNGFFNIRRGFINLLVIAFAILCLTASSINTRAADVVLVMPFENRSQMGEYNWIRESFAILLSDVMDAPGVVVLNPDERNVAFERLRLSPNDILTRAAMIRVAESAQANLALVGDFDVGGDKSNITVSVSARLIEITEGRLVGNKVFNFGGSLKDLQNIQGQLAWDILNLRNPNLPFSKDQFVKKAIAIPPKAFESYVKAIQTTDEKLREGFLRRAIQEYENNGGTGKYSQALYELGRLSYRQSEYEEAIKYLNDIGKSDPNYVESRFFLGLSYYHSAKNNDAIAVFSSLVDIMPLPEILNNAGVMQAAKGDNNEALKLFQRAVANGPNDLPFRFNYGYLLWKSKFYPEAIQHLLFVTNANQTDGEAQYLLALCLNATNQQAAAAKADELARRYLTNYAKWAVDNSKIPFLARLKDDFNRMALYRLERNKQTAQERSPAKSSVIRQNLDNAWQKVVSNKDQEAMSELSAVFSLEPSNPSAHYIRGVILYRRGEMDSAVNALQTAVFYNPRMIEGHTMLGRIYLSRGDRSMAVAYSSRALDIDPQNKDAVALKQQIEQR